MDVQLISVLHLPAIAHEAGVELNLDIVNEISQRHQIFVILHQQVDTHIEDLYEAGGVQAVMNELI